MFITKIDTFTELRARAGEPNSSVEVLGILDINDGDGGTFYWDSTSTAPDDHFDIVKVTGVNIGRWIRLLVPSSDIPTLAQVTAAGNTTTLSIIGKTEPTNENSTKLASTAWVVQKISSIPTQVNSDWNATSGVAMILNKPTIPAAQIQSDWNQLNSSAVDFIKNKPTLLTPIIVSTSLASTLITASYMNTNYPSVSIGGSVFFTQLSDFPDKVLIVTKYGANTWSTNADLKLI